MVAARSTTADGAPTLVGLLLAVLALVVLLAWQAVEASRSHRAVAESLLRDYAQLAADEMVRRSTAEVGYRGYYPLLTALQQEVAASGGALPERAVLVVRRPRLARALGLAAALFTSAAGGLAVEGGGGEGLRQEIVALEPPDEGLPYAVHHGRRETIAYAALDEPGGIVGFVVDPSALREWFRSAFERGPLLPPSLTEESNSERLVVWITGEAGDELFRAGSGELDSLLAVHQAFGEAYSGVLEGLTVHVSLDPQVAERLVIGGLPRSRLSMLLLLLLVTGGLLSLAILQVRRARALDRLRADFVSEVSHELRTPLTQIRMFAETLLLGRIRSEEEERRSLEIIDAEARRLSRLVENTLQFSRGERGRIELAPRVRELAPLVEGVLRDFAPLTGGREARLRLEPLDRAARAAVDDEAMRQILLNLLDNAVKYGPRRQEIRIGLERDGDRVRLWVDDEGPGVPESDRRRIWRSFERLDRDRGSGVAGTGIGLAVVRELVERQGGTVEVNRGARGGARFVVALPAAENGR